MSHWSTRDYHPHQFVKVAVSPTKTEIGIVVSVEEHCVVVSTRHGYNITAKPMQLQRAFLLVLDLNGVLGARQKKTLFERRPHLEKFLKFALTNFVVAVWTSCEERNGVQIVDDLLADDRDRLLFCLYRGDCTPNPTPEKPFGTIKNLQRIFDRWPESFHAVNTVIVDDSSDKCSHPDIALCPPPFASLSEQPDDDGLLSTIAVLEQILAEDSLNPLIAAAAAHRKLLQESAAASRPVCIASAAVAALDKIPFDETAKIVSATDMKSLQEKRVICCHFALGTCKFGTSCKFLHTTDTNIRCNRGNSCRVHRGRDAETNESRLVALDHLRVIGETHHVTSMDSPARHSASMGGVNNLAAVLLAKLNTELGDHNIHISSQPTSSSGANEARTSGDTVTRHDDQHHQTNLQRHDRRAYPPQQQRNTSHQSPSSQPSVVAILQNAHRELR